MLSRIQPASRKLPIKLTAKAFITFIYAGIVAITPSLASADNPSCDPLDAVEAGIHNYIGKSPPTPIGDTAFYTHDGDEVRLVDYRGTALVLNFWATWCAPCIAEMPALDRLKGKLEGTGIDVLAVNEDRDGEKMAAKFYETNNIGNLDILIDRKMALIKATKVAGLPTTILIDAQGNEVGSVVGEAEWDSDDTVAFLKACLKPGM